MTDVCGFCKGKPVGDAATWVDGKPRPPAPCPRCGKVVASACDLYGHDCIVWSEPHTGHDPVGVTCTRCGMSWRLGR